MKSQDILLLLKLISLQQKELSSAKSSNFGFGPSNQNFDNGHFASLPKKIPNDWHGWEDEQMDNISIPSSLNQFPETKEDEYSVRGLSRALGISKTEINLSIKRSISIGMINIDRKTNHPKPNITTLKEFIIYGLKYVFPVTIKEVGRGIPTSFAAPVLEKQLITAGDLIYVWSDPYGKNKGQIVSPLYKSVPYAVRNDPQLYEFLALIDAIRLGFPREAKLAANILEEVLY